jgi:hypothetical protein
MVVVCNTFKFCSFLVFYISVFVIQSNTYMGHVPCNFQWDHIKKRLTIKREKRIFPHA